MAIPFNPPEWLIKEYMNRKSPGQELLDTGLQAAQTYANYKQAKDAKQKEEGQRDLNNYLTMLQTDPALLQTPFGQSLQKKIGGTLGNYQPPGVSTPTAQPTGEPQTAGTQPPGMTSPIIAHANSVFGGQAPAMAGTTPDIAGLQGRGKLGEKAIGQIKTGLEINKLQNDISGGTPNSLEELLTKNVREGKMTLQEALDAKAKSSPSYVKPTPPPPGFRFKSDGSLEPIPGGPVSIKQDEKQQKEKGLRDAAITQADTVIGKVDQALSNVSGWTTGFGGAVMKRVPGSSAVNLEKDVDTIKANLGFSTLQEMRRNSPTGGALGAISDRELTLLTSALSSLDTAQSKEQLKRHLGEVKTHYENWKQAVQGGSQAPEQGQTGTGLENLSEEELQAIINGR